MSELKTNKISPQTGTDLQLGESGQTITLASGATASGFDGILKSAIDPVVNENPFGGVGTVFLNTTTGEMYSLTDATTNANVWTNIGEGVGDVPEPVYMSATGGDTVLTSGDYKVHIFTQSGAFVVTTGDVPVVGNVVEYLVVAGGGGGSASTTSGGGGGGGYLTATNFTVVDSSITVTIGAGGGPYVSGNDSEFSTITSIAGGRGGRFDFSGDPGGSGGGGGASQYGSAAGTPGQGNNGGVGNGTGGGLNVDGGGGGGGAGSAGLNGGLEFAGNGGAGLNSSISGTSVGYSGGGGGGLYTGTVGTATHGAGHGGNSSSDKTSGVVNTGGGGGAGYGSSQNGSGGSGIVIIKYKFQN